MPKTETPAKRRLREIVVELKRTEIEQANAANELKRLTLHAEFLRKQAGQMVKLDEFVEMVRHRRSDMGLPREGSSAHTALGYLRANPGPHTLDELMTVVGTKNRKSFAVTMVKLKNNGHVRGGQHKGGFTAVRGRG